MEKMQMEPVEYAFGKGYRVKSPDDEFGLEEIVISGDVRLRIYKDNHSIFGSKNFTGVLTKKGFHPKKDYQRYKKIASKLSKITGKNIDTEKYTYLKDLENGSTKKSLGNASLEVVVKEHRKLKYDDEYEMMSAAETVGIITGTTLLGATGYGFYEWFSYGAGVGSGESIFLGIMAAMVVGGLQMFSSIERIDGDERCSLLGAPGYYAAKSILSRQKKKTKYSFNSLVKTNKRLDQLEEKSFDVKKFNKVYDKLEQLYSMTKQEFKNITNTKGVHIKKEAKSKEKLIEFFSEVLLKDYQREGQVKLLEQERKEKIKKGLAQYQPLFLPEHTVPQTIQQQGIWYLDGNEENTPMFSYLQQEFPNQKVQKITTFQTIDQLLAKGSIPQLIVNSGSLYRVNPLDERKQQELPESFQNFTSSADINYINLDDFKSQRKAKSYLTSVKKQLLSNA